jgi:uncharacterized protein
MFEQTVRPRTGSLLFLPARWQRVVVLKWLKRTHAWTGFWGAMLFFMIGISGFLLNHRSVLKIDTGAPVEVLAMDVAVRPGQFRDADALGAWARSEFALPVDGRAPPAKDEGKKKFMGKPVPEAERWMRAFNLPDERITVSHVPGSPSVSVKRESVGLLGTLKNLHKGTGAGMAWVLFIDTIAGALIAMSITGFLLWSRLHGSRLLAGGIVMTSVALATASIWPFIG